MPDPLRDDRGHSEETCIRCGWTMGDPALNCRNDDTPHRFPSQEIELASRRSVYRGDGRCGVTSYSWPHFQQRATAIRRRSPKIVSHALT